MPFNDRLTKACPSARSVAVMFGHMAAGSVRSGGLRSQVRRLLEQRRGLHLG